MTGLPLLFVQCATKIVLFFLIFAAVGVVLDFAIWALSSLFGVGNIRG